MIPENVWQIYIQALKFEKKFITWNSHLKFLVQCEKEKRIPNGFRYMPKINYEDLKMDFQIVLDKASKMMVKKTIKFIKGERQKVDIERRRTKQDLHSHTNGRLRAELKKRLYDVSYRFKEKLERVKERKLVNLVNMGEESIEQNPGIMINRQRRNRRRRHNHRKRSAKSKRRRRRTKMEEKENEFIEQLRDIETPPSDRFTPFDNTNYNMRESEKEVCAKGLKFVPTVKRVDLCKKKENFERFCRSLRLAVFFHSQNEQNGSRDYVKYPWTQRSNFNPPTTCAKLEEYLAAIEGDLFNPLNFRKVPDNLNPEQRVALKSLKKWNSDDTNPRMFRCQDKGARLVIEFKERYHENVVKFLEDGSTFREDNQDSSDINRQKVFEWADKWHKKKEISLDVKKWIVPTSPSPAVTHANIKTHKPNLPYRHIISSRGTATERLARWTEYHLQPYSNKHKAFLKNTTSFLNFIDDINIRKGPFDEVQAILSTRDIDNFYPSCNTNKCIEAIESILNGSTGDNGISKDCIVEAVRITMSCNNIEYKGRHFTQINGATIGGPNSSSVTDIFGALFIDKVIEDHCPYDVEEYRRYRDDTITINCNSTILEQDSVTTWLNENIYRDAIKFQMDSIIEEDRYVNFLDITARIRDGYIVTETYSKPTDIHQYLNPSSCHPKKIFKCIPKSVIIRQRRNCSRTGEFIKCSREFKGYLVMSGYDEKEVDKSFAPFINVKRKELLKEYKQDKNKKKGSKKYRFITDYEPAFTDIRKTLIKHKNILEGDQFLKKVFPNGTKDFQITERRGAFNIKELLAPSKMKISLNEEADPGSKPCGKGCIYCPVLNRTKNDTFISVKTGKAYKVRQNINCETMHVIYSVTCGRHSIQGIGRATSIKSRYSNYKSHHVNKVPSCKITEHFLNSEHDFDTDFIFQPIVKLTNSRLTTHEKIWKLEEFELYWQENLCTIEPHGMNSKGEAEKAFGKIRKRKLMGEMG